MERNMELTNGGTVTYEEKKRCTWMTRSKKNMARTKYNFWIYIPVLSLILSLTHHSSQESWWEFREATLQPVSAKTLFLFLSCWMLFLSLAISIFFYGECHHWCCIVQSFCHTGWHSAKKITFPFICGANAFSFFFAFSTIGDILSTSQEYNSCKPITYIQGVFLLVPP